MLPDVAGLNEPACLVIGFGGVDRGPPRIRRGRSRPAGVFPLGFGGQGVGPARGQTAGVALEFVEAFEKELNVVPGNPFHRTVRIACGVEFARVVPHYGLILSLGDLVLPQVKTLGEGHLMLGFVGVAAGFRDWAAHGEGPGRTPDQGEIRSVEGSRSFQFVKVGHLARRQSPVVNAHFVDGAVEVIACLPTPAH